MEETNISSGALYTLQLPSKLDSIVVLENLVEELCERYQTDEDTFANMMTCLNEAVMNAILHGNKLDENKKVYINAEVFPGKKMIWTVADEGDGFDYTTLPDPTLPENVENLTGRGVFILKQLADHCVFNTKGNEIELHFKF